MGAWSAPSLHYRGVVRGGSGPKAADLAEQGPPLACSWDAGGALHETSHIERVTATMGYTDQESVEPDLRFKSPSGLLVKTTGKSLRVDTKEIWVHEVIIEEGPGKGNTFVLNLDVAEPL